MRPFSTSLIIQSNSAGDRTWNKLYKSKVCFFILCDHLTPSSFCLTSLKSFKANVERAPASQLFYFHIFKQSKHISIFFYVGLEYSETITPICLPTFALASVIAYFLSALTLTTFCTRFLPRQPLLLVFLKVGSGYSWLLGQGRQNFTLKGKLVIILGFAGCMVSVATTEFCYCSKKAAIHNTQRSKAVFWILSP